MPSHLQQVAEATPTQLSRWQSAKAYYLSSVTKTCGLARDLATLCASAQDWSTSRRIWHVFALTDESNIKTTLNNYNTLGRIVQNVELGNYLCSDYQGGDIAVSAPLGASPERYQNDVYLGIVWWIPVLAGALICGGIWASLKRLEVHAANQKTDLANRLLSADQDIAKSTDPKVKADWSQWKKDNAAIIGDVQNAAPGLIDKLLGGGSGKNIVLGLLFIGGVWALLRGTTNMRRG